MFGYVMINKPELKIREYEEYHSFYCGLCHTLKEEFGFHAQLTLNNDLTFIAMLLTSLYEPKTEELENTCILHPIHKYKKKMNECIQYAACMTIVLTYFKCEDDWLDEHKWSKRLSKTLLKRQFQNVETIYPDKVRNIKKYLKRIHELEKKKNYTLDEISKYSGMMLGEICAYKQDEWYDELFHFGFYLGKFIYFMDAYEDYEQDMEKGCFNPFKSMLKRDNAQEEIHNILEMMISQATDIFEYLPLVENVEIMRNILYSGVWNKYEFIKNKRAGNVKNGSL